MPKVSTSLPEGYAADLLWWCPTGVTPIINGIKFDEWYEAAATWMPDRDGESQAWEFIGALDWAMKGGMSMTESEGTMRIARIGARLVTVNMDYETVETSHGNHEDARSHFFADMLDRPREFAMTLHLPGERPQIISTMDDPDPTRKKMNPERP